jgi:hypothetical protein
MIVSLAKKAVAGEPALRETDVLHVRGGEDHAARRLLSECDSRYTLLDETTA